MRLAGSFAAAMSVVLVGCSSPTEEDLSATSEAIIGGTKSTSAADAVVRLDIGYDTCTGTLLTPRLVLTARHCVSQMNTSTECGSFTRMLPSSSVSVSVGVNGNQRVAHGAAIYIDGSSAGCSHDIALVELDTEVSAPVATIRFTAVAKGEAAKTMGYGDDGHGTLTPGRYEKAGLTIDAVGPATPSYKTKSGHAIPYSVSSGELVTGESTCFGDSGGPLFDAAGSLIGLTSRGIDQACIDRPTIFSDVASHQELIQVAAQGSGHPLVIATATPAANPAAAAASGGDATPVTSTPSDGADAGEEATPAKKKTASAPDTASGGCSSAPGQPGSALLLATALAVAARARRLRAPRSSARSSSR